MIRVVLDIGSEKEVGSGINMPCSERRLRILLVERSRKTAIVESH
jgi:hypothetical protein